MRNGPWEEYGGRKRLEEWVLDIVRFTQERMGVVSEWGVYRNTLGNQYCSRKPRTLCASTSEKVAMFDLYSA